MLIILRRILIMISSSIRRLICLTKCLVCGNDRARSDCAKSFYNISYSEKDYDNDIDIEGPSTEKNVQDVSETSQVKEGRKRSRSSDVQDVVSDISTKLGEVVTTISKMTDSRLDVTKLYEEVMASEGNEEEFLGDAFDYLVQNETLAKAILAKIKIFVKCGWKDSSDNNKYKNGLEELA